MNRWSPDLYNNAWYFATLAHEKQTYGGKEANNQIAYINHIGSVAMEVIWGLTNSSKSYDADLAVQCALLHDVIEDTPYTYNDIIGSFQKSVADGVLALSKREDITATQKLQDSISRIKQQPHEIWMVKMADRITNLYHPPFYWTKDKMKSYREEAQFILEELHTANEILAHRLSVKIEEYKDFYR